MKIMTQKLKPHSLPKLPWDEGGIRGLNGTMMQLNREWHGDDVSVQGDWNGGNPEI